MSAKSSTRRGVSRRAVGVSVSVATLSAVLLLASAVLALERGDTPPPIDLPDLEGARVDLAELEGKVVVVDFWASWCGPCREAMPVLEALHKRHHEQGLVVVGVNLDRNPKRMRRFLQSHPVSFRIVHDRNMEVAGRYQPPVMPSSFLIARDGTLRYLHAGFGEDTEALLSSHVAKLLGDTLPP